VERLQGGQKPVPVAEPGTTGPFDVEEWVRALFHNTYNRRDLSTVDRFYAPNVRWYGTTNRQGYGKAQVQAMARALLSTFPDLGVHVDEVYWMGNPDEGYRVSVRWGGAGTHKGYSLYGPPTGRQVHIWGMSQLYVRHGRIVEEWALFNEFDVMAQLLRDEPAPLL
jgi:predicted ester cyclase